MPIKALLFDVGFTLQNDGKIFTQCIDFTGKWLKRKKAIHSIQEFRETYLKADAKMHSPVYSHVFGELDVIKAVLKKMNADTLLAEKAIQRWHSFQKKLFKPNKEFKQALELAKNSGFKTAIVSNDRAERLNAIIDKYSVRKLLDAIIVSEALGVEKPNPKIFKAALKKLKVKPSEAIMFGDNPASDGACKKLGIKWVKVKKFDRGKYWEKGRTFKPDFEIWEVNKKSIERILKALS